MAAPASGPAFWTRVEQWLATAADDDVVRLVGMTWVEMAKGGLVPTSPPPTEREGGPR